MTVRVIVAPPEAAAARAAARGCELTKAEHAQALAVVNAAALHVAADQMRALARREAARLAAARAASLAGLVMARRRLDADAASIGADRGRSIDTDADPPPLDAADLAPLLRHGPPRLAGEAMTDLAPVPVARRLERGSPLARAA